MDLSVTTYFWCALAVVAFATSVGLRGGLWIVLSAIVFILGYNFKMLFNIFMILL